MVITADVIFKKFEDYSVYSITCHHAASLIFLLLDVYDVVDPWTLKYIPEATVCGLISNIGCDFNRVSLVKLKGY